ncbi:hypothetical protein ABZX85_06785 [Streptomyces sp. NPDC004539]|uniref:hypothetical protein n=1 Tax=Streptomyces sp. NPDC004539 TaxID=3154280 RepID=UPI0033A7BB90
MTAGWCARTGRAAMFAAVCVVLAALGHVLMAGRGLPVWSLGAAFAVTAAAGWTLGARERGTPLIVAAVVAVQAALHQGFSAVQSGGSGAAGAGGTAGMADMHMDMGMGMPHMDMSHDVHDGTGSPLADASTASYASYGMLLAHLLAALLCGLWLAYGERAVFRTLRAAGARLAAPLRLVLAVAVPPRRPSPPRRRPTEVRAPKQRLLVHSLTSRGPPRGCAVA